MRVPLLLALLLAPAAALAADSVDSPLRDGLWVTEAEACALRDPTDMRERFPELGIIDVRGDQVVFFDSAVCDVTKGEAEGSLTLGCRAFGEPEDAGATLGEQVWEVTPQGEDAVRVVADGADETVWTRCR